MWKKLILTFAPLILLALPAFGQSFDQVVSAEILPGWQKNDGSRVAAIRLKLNPGWKTYWRAPGDAGIPPRFNWSGSFNLGDVAITWPTPEVLSQNGMQSIGYTEEVILPLLITPRKANKQIRLRAVMDIGVCRDICVPQRLKVSAKLPTDKGQRDPRIAAAMASRLLSETEAGLKKASCRITATNDGLNVTARLHLPSAGGPEVTVIETDNPQIWVSEATTHREGAVLVAQSQLMHVDGDSFMVNRSTLRITVLGRQHAVDIKGCTAG